eukprot:8154995-Karenia_brevis.AAC.1
MIWNPALEARPAHICRLYGDNRGIEVQHIVLSSSQQGRGDSVRSSVQSTDEVPYYFQPREGAQDVPGSGGPLPT